MHNVLSCRGLPEQRLEVRMNGKSESSKKLGKAFKWTEDQVNGPKVGKLSCMRTGWKASRSRGERLSGRMARGKVRKTGFISQRT